MRRRIRTVVLCVGLCFSLAACQTTGGEGRPGSGARGRLVAQTDDYRRTIVEGAAVGAAVGGIGAALITAAAGGDSRQALRNGLIGVAVGGLVGAAAGKDVADRKGRYVVEEDQLGGVIRRAEANNAKLSGMVATSAQIVRQRRAEVARLAAGSAAERRALATAIGDDEQAIARAISATEAELDQLRSFKSRLPTGSPALQRQIGSTEAKRDTLGSNRKSLIDMRKGL